MCKNAIAFYYIHAILHTFLMLAMSACGLFVHFYYKMYAEVALPELLKEPHQLQPIVNFPKGSFG